MSTSVSEPRPAPAACAACGGTALRVRYRLRPFDVWTCAACGIGFRHPQPSPEALVDMYEDERYLASRYFADTRTDESRESPEVRIFRRGLAELAALTPAGGRRLLDVGCGPGVFLDLARAAGFSVAGIEISSSHVASARDRLGLDVRQGDFREAPFADVSFDAVTMWDFLEHVGDPCAALAEARRLLVPGGVLLVFTIDCDSLFNIAGDALYRATGGRVQRPLELLYDARHNIYFTRPGLARLLQTSGFTVVHWRSDRAYLGRWVSEPAPWWTMAGGAVLDLVSQVVRRPYRQTALCVSDRP